jgi:hypothetical protein
MSDRPHLVNPELIAAHRSVADALQVASRICALMGKPSKTRWITVTELDPIQPPGGLDDKEARNDCMEWAQLLVKLRARLEAANECLKPCDMAMSAAFERVGISAAEVCSVCGFFRDNAHRLTLEATRRVWQWSVESGSSGTSASLDPIVLYDSPQRALEWWIAARSRQEELPRPSRWFLTLLMELEVLEATEIYDGASDSGLTRQEWRPELMTLRPVELLDELIMALDAVDRSTASECGETQEAETHQVLLRVQSLAIPAIQLAIAWGIQWYGMDTFARSPQPVPQGRRQQLKDDVARARRVAMDTRDQAIKRQPQRPSVAGTAGVVQGPRPAESQIPVSTILTSGEPHAAPRPPDAPADLITVDQAAALVQVHKRTLYAWNKKDPWPQPVVEGGDGRCHRFSYKVLRPWLAKHSRIPLRAEFSSSPQERR